MNVYCYAIQQAIPMHLYAYSIFIYRKSSSSIINNMYIGIQTRTKLAENFWNTFEHLRATWISVEPRSLLVTRHDPSTFPKIGSKNATNFWNCSKSLNVLKKFEVEKISLSTTYIHITCMQICIELKEH